MALWVNIKNSGGLSHLALHVSSVPLKNTECLLPTDNRTLVVGLYEGEENEMGWKLYTATTSNRYT